MRLVVVGGDAAGGSVASNAKRRNPELEVVLFERGGWTSYSACGFPYMLAGHIDGGWERLVVRSPDGHRERGIDVRERTAVTAIDLDGRHVRWRDAEGREGAEPFDFLAYTTGAHDRDPELPGLAHGFPVFTPRQARRLGEVLPAVRQAVIVGGGYIGVEMAEGLRARGVTTTMITRSDQVMRRTLDADMAPFLQEALTRMGVDLRLRTPLEGIDKRPGGGYAVATPDGPITTDLVILAIGSAPTVELAEEAGLPLGATGAVAVDHQQRTSIAGIYAAGDCAEAWDRVGERWVNHHLGTIANKAGRVAGLNIGAESRGLPPPESFSGIVGTAIARVGVTEVARTGLGEAEAEALGLPVRTATVETTQFARYMPESAPMHVKLVARADSGRLLGGQIIGQRGSAKRIDTLAVALSLGLDARALVEMDLAYAPPFSSVWDPLQTAARRLVEA